MKINASVTKSSHEDRDPCCLHLTIFFLYIHSPLLLENKKLLASLFSSANQTTDHCSIGTSNHLFGKAIWDKFGNIKIFKNYKGNLFKKSPKPNLWLLFNRTKPVNTLYRNYYLLTAGNHRQRAGNDQNKECDYIWFQHD